MKLQNKQRRVTLSADITVRDIRKEDMNSLAVLYSQFWGEKSDIAKMSEKFKQLQNDDAYILLCTEEQGKLTGSVMGIVCEELYGECEPFLVLENMVVDSNYRQRGIGRQLFAELEIRAKQKGCRQIILVTETNRKDARAFYESLGFHPADNKGYKKKIV